MGLTELALFRQDSKNAPQSETPKTKLVRHNDNKTFGTKTRRVTMPTRRTEKSDSERNDQGCLFPKAARAQVRPSLGPIVYEQDPCWGIWRRRD